MKFWPIAGLICWLRRQPNTCAREWVTFTMMLSVSRRLVSKYLILEITGLMVVFVLNSFSPLESWSAFNDDSNLPLISNFCPVDLVSFNEDANIDLRRGN